MKKKNRNRNLKAIVLLLSLVLPLIINAAHYLLFQHHEQDLSFSLRLEEKENSHILCSYPFVTEEFSPAIIRIQRPEIFLHIPATTKRTLINNLRIFNIQGRAPPAAA
jgi:hypothetical protein